VGGGNAKKWVYCCKRQSARHAGVRISVEKGKGDDIQQGEGKTNKGAKARREACRSKLQYVWGETDPWTGP